ncbi:phage portal protein [Cereibacter sphaeroides]|uniref:phage portal protein n=1 Tax=Cereibacter sphaeroides TaxID=1063 RepID=UPI001F1F6D61|nr:phage portal protein [Cereibacter sphaeroides]MCE6960583.1 phage portal protein [Cereibacter sphaeroides]MCE6972736.1 phage portal protein [Cereibacter sphaeroides]
MKWPFTRKSLATPSDDLSAIFGVLPTYSGAAVTPLEALKVPAVSAAVRTISEAAATLDVKVVAIGPDGTETDVMDHPALALLRGRANDWTSGFELVRDLVIDALLTDVGALAWVNRVDGRPVEIIHYKRGVMAVEFDQATGEPRYSLNSLPLDAADVIHVREPFGRCPVTLAREAIAAAIVMERHAARLFGRGARPSGVLKFPKGMGEESVKKARAAWRMTHEGQDAGGQTAILYDGAEFEPLTLASTDAQFLENRKFQFTEIARAFNLPAPMIGDLERATWGNAEQKAKEFLIYALEPRLKALEGALGRALLSPAERGTHAIRFDRDDISRADLATRATTISSLISSQVLNPNEGRSWLGLQPREGGEAFMNPNIATAATSAPQEASDDAE